jgi:hypothetical protein
MFKNIINIFRSNNDPSKRIDTAFNEIKHIIDKYLLEEFTRDEVREKILNIFNFREIPSNASYQWWVFLLVYIKNKTRGEDFEASQFFNENINYDEAILTYRICLAYGCFEVGYSIRAFLKECLEKTNLNSKSSQKEKINMLALWLENQNYTQIRNEIKNVGLKKKYRSLFLDSLNIIEDVKFSIFDFKGVDKDFFEYVNHKSVAIVGPAKTNEQDAKEIDSFDIVIRLNHKDKNIGIDPFIKGEKCDISYFNVEHTQIALENNLTNWSPSLVWAIFNNNETVKKVEKKLCAKSYGTKLRIRNAKYNLTSFNTGYTALPKAVIDILRFKPAHVKIFHADLMLTVDREVGYKPSTWTEDMRAFFLEICSKRHDPVTQFYIMKNLCASRVISGDKRFDEVISLSPQQYMKELDKIYG